MLLEISRICADKERAVWFNKCRHMVDFAIDNSLDPQSSLLHEPDDVRAELCFVLLSFLAHSPQPLSFVNGVAGFVAALSIIARGGDDWTFPVL